MNKLILAKKALDERNVFDGKFNQTALDMVSMLEKDVPFTMALGLANFTMATFIGHFHTKIKIKEDNLPPPNMIAFILAKSGAKKTSSIVNLEKAISRGTNIINQARQAKLDNKLLAMGEDANDLPASKKRLTPLSNALGTQEGVIRMLNEFKEDGLGLPNMVVDEISTELATSSDIKDNMKLGAELFDDGNKKAKPLKDAENQSEEVRGMGMCLLFIGSEHGILENPSILKVFFEEFISKYARRCFFIYPDFIEHNEDYESFDDILEEMEREESFSEELHDKINELSERIASRMLLKDMNIIEISDEANYIYKAYKIYCIEKSKNIISEPLNLEQQHRHWKAFKLSAVYALFNEHKEITAQDMKQAINCAELTAGDLSKFIDKANRETYEVLLEHFVENPESELTVHEMVKLGWIKKKAHLKDMLILANSKIGKDGILEEDNDKVVFTKYVKSDSVGISYKKVSGTKDERKRKVADGFKYVSSSFPKVGNIMKEDTAFIPFKFKNGVRGKDNIDSGADFIMLDIDNSDITMQEASDMLCDFKHICATTSDPNNPYKFRILMTTDIVVNVDGSRWLQLMRKIAEYLCLDIDVLPQSQIYYGYKDSKMIVNEEGDDLEVSSLLQQLGERPQQVQKLVTEAQFKRTWEDRRNVFNYAYDRIRPDGTEKMGLHLSLFRAMYHARDLGFSYSENCILLAEIISESERKPRDDFYASLESQRREAYSLSEEDILNQTG